jgi:hypothetical protein
MEKLPMDDSLRIMTQYATFFAIEARCAALDAITGPAEWQMEYADGVHPSAHTANHARYLGGASPCITI